MSDLERKSRKEYIEKMMIFNVPEVFDSTIDDVFLCTNISEEAKWQDCEIKA